MNSNPAQTEAIRHGEGPMLVLAGPGSGKTYVITRRVRHLIEQLNVRPDHVLVITYSKAAADEMRERFLNASGGQYPGVTFGTFHAVFFHILQIAYNLSATHILKEETAVTLLRDILSELQPELSEEPEMLLGIREEITRYKASLPPGADRTDESYEPLIARREIFYPVLKRYLKEERDRNLVDFEDMLYLTLELFQKRPELLTYWQDKFRYLLIDEFQDINPIQYEVIKKLAGPRANLFVVGDDDQSIYGFRGASPGIMLRFPKDYPRTANVSLNVNYRCSAEILSAASSLIAFNEERYEKDLCSSGGSRGPVRFIEYDNTDSEFRGVASQLKEWITAGVSPDEIAVLFRTNLEMRGLLPVLERAGIPFCCHALPPSLYRHALIEPVISYLRVAAGGTDRGDWLKIVNKPVRYVERSAFGARSVNLKDVYSFLHKKGKDYVIERLQKLEFDLKRLGAMNPYAAIHYIRHIIGYNRYLSDTLENPAEGTDLLDELMQAAAAFRSIDEFLAYVDGEEARRRKQQEALKQRHGVSLMTFHRSKGLEFRHVILCDCNELITPHKKALLPEQIAEERRLFYVAMTRASDSLTLCYVRKHLSHEQAPSRFLGEIRLPKDAVRPGTRVVHEKFGAGTVTGGDEKEIRIRFDGHLLPRTFPLVLLRESGVLVKEEYA